MSIDPANIRTCPGHLVLVLVGIIEEDVFGDYLAKPKIEQFHIPADYGWIRGRMMCKGEHIGTLRLRINQTPEGAHRAAALPVGGHRRCRHRSRSRRVLHGPRRRDL